MKSSRTPTNGADSWHSTPIGTDLDDAQGGETLLRRVAILLFSADEPAPRLVEVEGRVRNADFDEERDQTIWAPYFMSPAATQNEVVSVGELWRPASDDGSDPTADIPCNLMFSNRLCLIFYDPADDRDTSGAAVQDLEDNLAVQAATEGAVTHWKGNIVAYREYEAGGQVKYVDVTMDDLPALVQFLRKHGEPDSPGPRVPPRARTERSWKTCLRSSGKRRRTRVCCRHV
ncbi:hypothetical protein C8Q74DRAFT_831695 [Fomes fomentarius]|nr:hypothetical protein C8Q74DRAFT_831695 [Fomes fomentarius]